MNTGKDSNGSENEGALPYWTSSLWACWLEPLSERFVDLQRHNQHVNMTSSHWRGLHLSAGRFLSPQRQSPDAPGPGTCGPKRLNVRGRRRPAAFVAASLRAGRGRCRLPVPIAQQRMAGLIRPSTAWVYACTPADIHPARGSYSNPVKRCLSPALQI